MIENIKRMWVELTITFLVTVLFLTHGYEGVPNATQLVLLKINLVSMGLLHAHVAGKLIFKGKLDWQVPWEMSSTAHLIRGALYVTIPFMYAIGG